MAGRSFPWFPPPYPAPSRPYSVPSHLTLSGCTWFKTYLLFDVSFIIYHPSGYCCFLLDDYINRQAVSKLLITPSSCFGGVEFLGWAAQGTPEEARKTRTRAGTGLAHLSQYCQLTGSYSLPTRPSPFCHLPLFPLPTILKRSIWRQRSLSKPKAVTTTSYLFGSSNLKFTTLDHHNPVSLPAMADITDPNAQHSPAPDDPSGNSNGAGDNRGVKRPRVSTAADDDDDDDDKPGRERRKIDIKFIQDKSRRHITFSKRKAGIMKKVRSSRSTALFLTLFLCAGLHCAC